MSWRGMESKRPIRGSPALSREPSTKQGLNGICILGDAPAGVYKLMPVKLINIPRPYNFSTQYYPGYIYIKW